uniref:Uncharacterized protein n=1 Tax=Anopheles culicifacies TaxID=139723 RepID=A0A182M9D6_9DIPT
MSLATVDSGAKLPVVSDCPAGQTARVTSNLHSSSSTMANSRVPSPPLPEVNTPVAENWCYTQFKKVSLLTIVCEKFYRLPRAKISATNRSRKTTISSAPQRLAQKVVKR